MVDIKEIDKFIKYCGNMYNKNPNITITDATLYDGLCSYGIGKDKNYNLQQELNNLENSFKFSNNLNVGVDKRQNNFLQFASKKNSSKSEDIKIYFTTSKENIEFAVREIFNFIDLNNIETHSKVSNKLRTDSIVIRLYKEEDARKVINFINNNNKLNKMAKETNPFLLKEGVVGIAYDNLISYNKTLSVILKDYFEDLKNKKMLNNASLDNFNVFIKNYYANLYRNCSKITDIDDNPHYLKLNINNRFRCDGETINNFEQVTRLIINVCSNNMNLDSYFKFYDECVKSNSSGEFINYYEETYKRKKNFLNNQEINPNMINLLKNYINYIYTKYGDIRAVYKYINGYIDSKNINVITRDNDFRQKFIEYMLTPKNILKITNNNIEKYVNDVLYINNMYYDNTKQKNFR